jgi:rubrerythrin
MATKKDNKKHKDSVEEVSLDDLDLNILKEVGITDEEIKDFNKEKKERKNLKKKSQIIKKERKHNNNFEEIIEKIDDKFFNVDENNGDFLDLEYDEF